MVNEEKNFIKNMKYLVKEHLALSFQHQFSLLAPNEEMALVHGTRKLYEKRACCGHLGGKSREHSRIRSRGKEMLKPAR